MHLSSFTLESPPIPPPHTPTPPPTHFFSQIVADIFNAPVYLKSVPDAAAIGAALRAKHGWLCAQQKTEKSTPASTTGDPEQNMTTTTDYVPFSRVVGEGGSSSAVADDDSVQPGSADSSGNGSDGVGGGGVGGLRLAASPQKDVIQVYEGMAERFIRLEAEVKSQAGSA